jgi:low affinity Fe/Cu permease
VAEASPFPPCWRGCSQVPIFAFSDSWQLVMNTLTSVITFLMVFLIQTSHNRDSAALQADELIRVSEARNLFVGIEHLSPDEIADIRKAVHGHLSNRKQTQG